MSERNYTAKEMGAILDLTVARVGQLRKNGIITRDDSGRYDLAAVTQYLKWFRTKKSGDEGKAGKAKARLLSAQADKIERENNIAEEEIAPVAFLEAALADVLSQMVAIFDAMPMNLKRLHPKLTARDIHMIKKDLATLRNIAADANIKENFEKGK